MTNFIWKKQHLSPVWERRGWVGERGKYSKHMQKYTYFCQSVLESKPLLFAWLKDWLNACFFLGVMCNKYHLLYIGYTSSYTGRRIQRHIRFPTI